MGSPTWKNTRHLLADYEGICTEIFIVGFSLSRLREVVAVLGRLPGLEVVSFENEGLVTPQLFDGSWRARLESKPNGDCQHALLSARDTPRHLQVYLWMDVENEAFEIELAFWNDMTFPEGLEEEEYERRLDELVSLAEACRIGTVGARCILTSEFSGSTEELLQRTDEYVVVW